MTSLPVNQKRESVIAQTSWQLYYSTQLIFIFANVNGILDRVGTAILLPAGSEERVVLGVGSIPLAILPYCQDMKTIA